MKKQFQKTLENFVCDNCGSEVVGDGYTNHCPECLWSKHVDIAPGDRSNSCCGPMEPIGFEGSDKNRKVVHRCLQCHIEVRCRLRQDDNIDAVISISQKRLYKQR